MLILIDLQLVRMGCE